MTAQRRPSSGTEADSGAVRRRSSMFTDPCAGIKFRAPLCASGERSAPFEIIRRVEVEFALKEIDRTNTRGVSFEDSTRSPVSTHVLQIGKKDGGKNCGN